MRRVLVVLHRWFGLFTAVFLFVAGSTGALIAWDHELDAWLNPDMFYTAHSGDPLPALALAERVEQADSRLRVGYTPLVVVPGHTALMSVHPRIDPATERPYQLEFDQIAVDPTTGAVQAKRMWGDASLSRKNLLPFLYKLHYSLHLPNGFGVELGVLFMGIVAIVWSLDALIALWISFPNWQVWRKSFAFRVRAGGYRLTFDLHRSGGVWVWPLLLMLAVTAVSMNLNREVVRPLVSVFSPLKSSPFASRAPHPPERPAVPAVSREDVLTAARSEAERLDIGAPLGGIFYSPDFDVYGVGFFEPGNDHGDYGLGNPWLYFDGQTAASLGGDIPGTGSAGDLFMQAQFPLHSGRLLGVPGRVIVSLLGLVVAMLSVTGVMVWARKRRARQVAASQRHKMKMKVNDFVV